MSSSPPVVARLAPSPTGALHLGNARTFLLAWLSARQQNGQVILRLEDIDSPRVKPWAARATIDDLRWLGLNWDVGPDLPHSHPFFSGPNACVQTLRLPRYQQVLQELIERQLVYRCVCTRSEVFESASAPHESRLPALEGPIYPGTCRHQPVHASQASGQSFAWRWAFAPGEKVWCDQIRGEISARPAEQLGDFIVARGNTSPAYQLAVIVDDHDMRVTEVIRGDDLVYSTFRQLAMLEQLGWPAPIYYHVPLMVGTDGRRLAKRHGDTRLSFLREQGITPEAIVGYLAWTLNLLAHPQAISAPELVKRLDWQYLPSTPTVFELQTGLQQLKRLI